jgi:hypothetical protein
MPPVAPSPTADAAASSADYDNDFDAGTLASLLAGTADDAPDSAAPEGAEDEEQDEGAEASASQTADPAADAGDELPDDAAPAGDDAATPPATEEDEAAALDEEGRKARAAFTPSQQRIFDREIAKVKRKDREARDALERSTQEREAEVARLQQELETARAAVPAVPVAATAEQPLAGIDDEAALDQRLAQARAIRRWAQRHPQGGVIPGNDGKEIEITEERAAAMLDEADELIEVHAPKRRDFLAARATARQAEVQHYPWLKDPKSPATVMIEGALKKHPILRELFPDARLLLADMLVGAQVRSQRATAAAKPAAAPAKTTPPKAPASPAGGTRPPKVAAGPKRTAQSLSRLEEAGEDPDNAALGALLAATG